MKETKEDILDTQMEERNELAPSVQSIIGMLVCGRDMMSYEVLDLYPSVEAYDKSQEMVDGSDPEAGIKFHGWRLLTKEERHTTVSIPYGEVWTIVDACVRNSDIHLLKIVSPDGKTTGWTAHFYRLKSVDAQPR